jgi:GNAT superfamily N-acetyltransferase
MIIRKMKIADAESVAELSTQLGHPNSKENIAKRFLEIDGLETHALFIASTGNGNVCGFVQVNCDSLSLVSGPSAEIGALVVDEKMRSRGIGTALIGAAEDWARAKGISLVRLTSNIRRENAHRFYKREGFEILKTWHLFTKLLSKSAESK